MRWYWVLPRGSSVYLIFALIDCLSFAPIAGADDSNDRGAISEPHRENATINFTETVEPFFGLAVGDVLDNHAPGVGERVIFLVAGQWNAKRRMEAWRPSSSSGQSCARRQ